MSDDRPAFAERIPSVLEIASALLPYLWRARNLGWPGMSARDRDDMVNLTWDLERALERET